MGLRMACTMRVSFMKLALVKGESKGLCKTNRGHQ